MDWLIMESQYGRRVARAKSTKALELVTLPVSRSYADGSASFDGSSASLTQTVN
jgi:hypothetical protein